MTIATQKRLTLEEYLKYDDATDIRYELEDGVLVEMGAENPINAGIAVFLLAYFLQEMGVAASCLAIGHQIAVSSTAATCRQPDLIVHSKESKQAIYGGGKVLMVDMPAPLLVVEVVSNSAKDKQSRDLDYVTKRAEYAARGIPEYWIVDPVEERVLVLRLVDGEYQEQSFSGEQTIGSPTFPSLNLTISQVLSAGL